MPVPSPLQHRPAPPPSRAFPRSPRRFLLLGTGLAAALFAAWAGFGAWRATASGSADPPPGHLRYGFVLDGQSPDGWRVLEGYRLLHAGAIDTLIVSGVEIGGGVHFSTIWVRMLPLAGKEKERVLELRSDCSSTLCEARMMDAFFEARKVDSVVVVTSAYHVWRAASIFAKASAGRRRWFFQGAPDSRWDAGWTDREGLKSRFFEWTKRLTWVLFEQWKPVPPATAIRPGAIVRGDDLGRMPPPAWKTAP